MIRENIENAIKNVMEDIYKIALYCNKDEINFFIEKLEYGIKLLKGEGKK